MLPTLAFLSDQAPDTKVLLAYAILPLAIAAGLYLTLSRRDKADLGFRMRLVSVLPLIFGIIVGIFLSYKMATDFAYQQYNLIGQGRAVMHYVVLAVNLLGCVGIIAWNMAASKGPKYDF